MEKDLATKKELSPKVVLTIMLLSMTAGAMCLNKVAPILTQVITEMGIKSEAQGGMLISVFVFSGIFLALPIGMIITRYGVYKTGIFALLATASGSLIGAFPVSYSIMLLSRIIEGIGLVFLGTIGPATVANVFTDKNRGSAMGLLMCYMAFGQIIMFNIAPRIAINGSWKTLWWMTAIYAFVMLVIWVITIKPLDITSTGNTTNEQSLASKQALSQVLKNKYVWMVSIVLLLYLIPQQGVISFLPRYLSEVRGMDLVKASSITSMASVIGIPVGIVVGMIADKVGSRKSILGILMLACAAVYVGMPFYPSSSYLVMVLLYGIATMGIVGLCFSISAEVVDNPEQAGMATSVLNTMMWIGIFLSSTVFGMIVDKYNWSAAFYIMAPIAALGAILAFAIKKAR